MNRLLALVGLSLVGAALPPFAVAEPMDPALSRLRIAPNNPGCEGDSYCPDHELFERLVSELAVSMAPPINQPARGVGPSGFQLSLDTTLTTLDADQSHWVRGTEGDDPIARDMLNPSPSQVMTWNRVEARKGLPFGLELATSLAQALDTSLWTFGLQLRWAIFEGFHSDLGQLPDVAVGGGLGRSVGSHQLSLSLYSLELVFSKPFVVQRAWRVSPLLGLQGLFVEAESGVVDLTPGASADVPGEVAAEDGFAACRPQVGAQTAEGPALVRCEDGSTESDLDNNRSFDEVSQTRLRLAVGGRARYDFLTMGVSLMFDLLAPRVQAEVRDPQHSPDLSRQVAFNLSLGAVF